MEMNITMSDSSHIKTFSWMRLVASERCSVQPCSPFSPPHLCCLSRSAGARRIGPSGRGCLSVCVALFFSYDKQRTDFLGDNTCLFDLWNLPWLFAPLIVFSAKSYLKGQSFIGV